MKRTARLPKIGLCVLSLTLLFFMPNLQARNGIYFTGEGGIGIQNGLPSAESIGAQSSKKTIFPSAWRTSVGYNHDLNCGFGIGLNIGLGRYGKDTYDFANSSTTIRTTTMEFLGVGTFHLQRQVDIFGEAGGLRQTTAVSGFDDQTQIRTEVGIGGAYNFTPHFAGIMTYTHVFGQKIAALDNIGGQTPSLNSVLLGIRLTC